MSQIQALIDRCGRVDMRPAVLAVQAQPIDAAAEISTAPFDDATLAKAQQSHDDSAAAIAEAESTAAKLEAEAARLAVDQPAQFDAADRAHRLAQRKVSELRRRHAPLASALNQARADHALAYADELRDRLAKVHDLLRAADAKLAEDASAALEKLAIRNERFHATHRLIVGPLTRKLREAEAACVVFSPAAE